MADFKLAIEKVLKNEGGLVDPTPGIDGDETNWGIDEKFNPTIDPEKMSRDDAEDWYYKNYWLPMNLFSLGSQDIVDQLLDCGVNCGAHTSILLAQRAYNLLYPARRIKEDGDLGPATALAFNTMKHPHAFLNMFTHQRVKHYLLVLDRHPEKEPNRVGWINRI